MIKVSRILKAFVLYHGRSMSRPYTGKYIFLTPDPGYASQYTDSGKIQVYELLVPPGSIFSLKKADNLHKLSEAVNNPELMQKVMAASTDGELSWAIYNTISNDEFEEAEDLFKSLGFKGVWLGERTGVESVLMFNSKDVTQVGEIPATYKKPETGTPL